MIKHRIIILVAAIMLVNIGSCQQHSSGKSGNPPDNARKALTCLLPGYDSIICYTGSSTNMQEIKKGTLSDTIFIDDLFQMVKKEHLAIIIKPGGGADAITNFVDLLALAKNDSIVNISIDSGNSDEEKMFGFSTPPQAKAAIKGLPAEEPLQLNMPSPSSDKPLTSNKFPKNTQLTILFSSTDNIYAYMGADIKKGKKYSYDELKALILTKKADKSFSALLKPDANSSYKSTVNMLDLMSITGLKSFELVDISNEEEVFLNQAQL